MPRSLPLFDQAQRSLARLTIVLAMGLWLNPSAHAQPRRSVLEDKVPSQVMTALEAGEPQEVIVLFDDSMVERQALDMRTSAALTTNNVAITEFKSAEFRTLKQDAMAALQTNDVTVTRDYSHLPMSAVRIQSSEGLSALADLPQVVAVYEKETHHATLAQSLPLINQPAAQSAGHTGTGTTVAVLDTGCDYTHSAFGSCTAPGAPSPACRVAFAQDFTAVDDGSLDDHGHGTNVSGIALGVAPSADIAALDVFDGPGAGSDDVIAAINWCIANRATYNIVAMNLSLGSGLYDAECPASSYATPFANARQAGIVPVVASGNDADASHISSPACAPGAVRVGAVYDGNNGGPLGWGGICTDPTTAADQITCFSNSADFLTILAPGALITAAELMMGGTSQAAPHVAGAVAVLKGVDGTLTSDEVQWSMTGSGPIIPDGRNSLSFPRLDLTAAISVVQSNNQAPDTPSKPSPGDEARNVSLTRTLSWTAGDPDVGDTVEFDIYFGTSASPPRVEIDHPSTTYDPGPLTEGVYYWKVVARDNHDYETEGPVWSFNTENYDCTVDVIQDGSFEAGAPNPNWTEFSSIWGTPLFNGAGALDGDWYAYFGGGGAETAYVEQDVVFGDVSASLTFWLWIPASSGNGTDAMTVRIDGSPVFTVLENDSRFTGIGYAGIQFDLTPLADGNTHTVRFEYVSTGVGTTVMFLDLVSMSSCGTPSLYGDEIVSDFGAGRGTWHYDAGAWNKLSAWDPELMATWQDKVAVDFGDIDGTWQYVDSTGWEKITPWSPYTMTAFGDKLAAAFDAGRGIWLNDAGGWTKITEWEPVQMVAVGNTLYASFGPSRGLWTYDTSAGWDKVSSWHPYDMVAWGGTLVAAFDAGRGLWNYQGSDWTKLTSWEPQHTVAWGDRLAVGFGSGQGTWVYDTEWNKITSWDPYDLIVWKNQLIAAFDAGRGLWSYNEAWTKLTPWEPIELDARDGAFVAAFGAGRGIWMFDTDWTQITKWDPEATEIADTR